MNINANSHLINKKINIFFCITLIGLLVASIFHIYMYFIGMNYPWITFLFDPNDRFNDWHNAITSSAENNPYYTNSKAVPAYFPVIYKLMYYISGNGRQVLTAIYLAISLILIWISVVVASKYMYEKSNKTKLEFRHVLFLFLSIVLTYPSLFSLDRGNIDIWIGSLCLIYVALLNTKLYCFGYAALLAAICFKSYPIIFLLMSVLGRDYKKILLMVVLVISLNILAMATMADGFFMSVEGLKRGLSAYYDTYVIGGASLFATSDLYNPIRFVVHELAPKISSESSANSITNISVNIINWYGFFSLALLIINISIVLFVPITAWRKVLLLGITALMFPNVANDYKLCILFPGLMAFILNPRPPEKNDFLIGSLLLLLFIPKSYYFIDDTATGPYALKNILNPILLIAAEGLLIRDRRAWKRAIATLPHRLEWYYAPISKWRLF